VALATRYGQYELVLTVESVEGGYKRERLAAARQRGVVIIHGAVGDRGSA
jgi:hypothetical protein